MDDFIVRMEMETFMGLTETYKIEITFRDNYFIVRNNRGFVIISRESLSEEFHRSIRLLVDVYLGTLTVSKIYVQEKQPLQINIVDRRLPVSELVRYVYNYVIYDFTKWIAKLPPIVPSAPKYAALTKRDYGKEHGLPFAFIDDDRSL